MRIPRKKKKLIPKGIPYCYTPIGYDNKTHIYHTKVCPFYKHVDGLEGYCKLVKYEVDDQCKVCDTKMPKL